MFHPYDESCSCQVCNTEYFERLRSGSGSMMYGRSYGSTETPQGASGDIDPRNGTGHGTQYYSDGTRYSWDTNGDGESGQHWTNQNTKKGRSGRHEPPSHAK